MQSKEIKILPSGDKNSHQQSSSANLLNISTSAEPINHHKSTNKNEFDLNHTYVKEDQEVPLLQAIKTILSNGTSKAQISDSKTESSTNFQTFQLKSIRSSENDERDGRVSVTRAALRIAARHALEATINLYDRREPNMVHRGKRMKNASR